jgi:hypothetical protein
MIAETRRRLKEWGLWACGGEPSLSSMFKGIFGMRGGYDLGETPAHIQEIDHLVCVAPAAIRAILIKFYGSRGTIEEKAARAELDRRTFMRRVDRADWHVNSELDRLPTKGELPCLHKAIRPVRVSRPELRRTHNPQRLCNSVTRIQST